jgi:hypothetical protein
MASHTRSNGAGRLEAFSDREQRYGGVTMAHYRLIAARADALFASNMSAGSYPTVAEVCTAIRQALRAHGGARGCRGEVAAAFGDYPEVAVMRMRWARQVVLSTCMPSSATAASVAEELPEVALVSAASGPSHLTRSTSHTSECGRTTFLPMTHERGESHASTSGRPACR